LTEKLKKFWLLCAKEYEGVNIKTESTTEITNTVVSEITNKIQT
jgi:hypothetical protein